MQTNLGFGYDQDAWDGVFEMTGCRRALSPSKLPGMDYALNPYGGCEHGCVYCYAPEVTHQPWDRWRVVRVKWDIADRLRKEVRGLGGTVGIGTVTDPYQGAEARFHLTRDCLTVLRSAGMGVHIHTKSPLLLRDIDMILSMEQRIGVTLTGIDDRFSRITEPGAPLPQERLDLLRTLVGRGADCYALIEPLLDGVDGMEERFCDAIASTGVKHAMVGGLNGRPELNARLERMGIGGSGSVGKVKRLLSERGISVGGISLNR